VRPSLHFGMCGDDIPATVRFFQQSQIRDLVCDARQIPGHKAKGALDLADLRAFQQPFAEAGVALGVVTVGSVGRDGEGNAPAADLDRLGQDIAVLGQAGVPVAQVFENGSLPKGADPDRYQANVHRSYAQLAEAGAEADVRLALHGGWWPGHALWSVASYAALFAAVPDPHLGVSFCAGSFYQSGDDVVAAAHALAGRIHFVHFRDAAGVGGDCPEVLLGTGEVPFRALATALSEIGYDGPVHCEHLGRFDYQRHGEVIAAWGAGFMRALFELPE
jgi:sugar phosphate isomerase/epimerase